MSEIPAPALEEMFNEARYRKIARHLVDLLVNGGPLGAAAFHLEK